MGQGRGATIPRSSLDRPPARDMAAGARERAEERRAARAGMGRRGRAFGPRASTGTPSRPRAVEGARRLFVRETLKNRRARRVRLDEQTASELRRWRLEQAAERLAFGPPWKTDGGLGVEAAWNVTEADGALVHPDTLLGRWKRLVKMAGVPTIPLHGARHSYAEIALSAGIRLDVVSRTLGHSSSAFTADQYSHDSDAAAAEAAELIARTIEGR